MADRAAGEHAASLTDWLRSREDTELAALLQLRPDLALPAPADLPTLASRLSVRTSVQRAVDRLDGFTLRLLEALTLAASDSDTVATADALALLGGTEGELEPALGRLRELVLVWGGQRLHLVSGVREALGPYPGGLGRPAATLLRAVPDVQLAPVLRSLGLPPAGQPRAGLAVAAVLTDPAKLRQLIDATDPDERTVIERLAAGPPMGTVRRVRPGDPLPAAHRLAQRGLLVALDEARLELPREVGLALRDVPLGAVRPRVPEIAVRQHEPADLDRAGGTAVLEALRLVEALAEDWAARPPAQLRAGGLGVRDLRRCAKELGVGEQDVAVLAETAAAAGLLNSTHELAPVYLPTPEYDEWLARPAAARWGALAAAWLAMTRQPSAVSQRGERDRIVSALSPDAERGTAPALRAQAFAVLSTLPPGAAPQDREEVLDALAWQAPRRAAQQRPVLAAILAEADLLGLTAGGGLTGYTRTLLDGSRAVAEQVLAGALPAPVDHFLLQPDLTAVVPGPPTPALAHELGLVADLESAGGASVYRLTETTIRRALDAGRGAAELHRFVAENSRTPVPQALAYLIDDIARRHGALRAGVAAGYLRTDDEALLARVLADRRVAALGLRRLAPTVAVCSAPVASLLVALREAGYAPAAEAPDGEVIALAGDSARAPSRPTARATQARPALDSRQLVDLVRRIRAGDELTAISRRVQPVLQDLPGVTSAATMGTLRDAIRTGRRVLINCAEADGTAGRHSILPISMAGGFVRGHEPSSQRLQSFPLHRVIAVTILDSDSDSDGDGAS